MKGDISRSTFDRQKHFSGVRMQQGRVQLDADWNELVDIFTSRIETEAADLIGGCGAPLHMDGFRLIGTAGTLTAEEQARPGNQSPPPLAGPGDFYVTAGRLYVNGILCENDRIVPFTSQPDLPGMLPVEDAGTYLAYLDVWSRHLTTLEAPEIREVALGGPDTATRTKTVWQVRLLRLSEGEAGTATCLSDLAGWNALVASPTGRLAAQAERAETADDPCIVTRGGGYSRLENQLYRVEVHLGGDRNDTIFKWSRDNGTVAARWEGQSAAGDQLTVSTLGRDDVLRFAPDQWVELTDDTHELHGRPGTLVPVLRAENNTLTVDLTQTIGTETSRTDFPLNPRVRRWDGVIERPTNANWRGLESGVQVRFFGGSYRTGDYWLIPARTVTADVEWPEDASGDPLAVPPHGIAYHYCRLGLLVFDGSSWTAIQDCRRLFPPVSELTSLFYVSGDGQEATPNVTGGGVLLDHPLQVGVANGRWPVAGATVRFEVVSGGGSVDGQPSIPIATGPDGVATCTWTLGAVGQPQRVEARLLDAAGNPIHLPIRFTARYREGAGAEPGFRVVRVEAGGAPLVNDREIAGARLARGIQITCDAEDVANAAFGRKPVCFVTLYLPFPFAPDDRSVWNTNLPVGTQPVRLNGAAVAEKNTILWMPEKLTQTWLQDALFTALQQLRYNEPLLGYLTVKGNFIWTNREPDLYLDGDVFGRLRSDGGTDAVLPSGDQRRGGDLEMWFWLVQREGAPNIRVDPGNLIFGVVDVGGVVEQDLRILNEGGSTLTVTSFTFTGNTGDPFSSQTQAPLTVEPGESQTVRVRFHPRTQGRHSANLTLSSDDPDNPNVVIGLFGEGRGVLTRGPRVQFIHNVPVIGAVDVYLNATRLLNDFPVRRATPFIAAEAGRVRIAVTAANSDTLENALMMQDVTLEDGQAYLLITCGTREELRLVVVPNAHVTAEHAEQVDLLALNGTARVPELRLAAREAARTFGPLTPCDPAAEYVPFEAGRATISAASGRQILGTFAFDLSDRGGEAVVLLSTRDPSDNESQFVLFGFDGQGRPVLPEFGRTPPVGPVLGSGGRRLLIGVPTGGQHDVAEVRGIGPTLATRLEASGITRTGQLASMEPGQLSELLNIGQDRAEAFINDARRLLEEPR